MKRIKLTVLPHHPQHTILLLKNSIKLVDYAMKNDVFMMQNSLIQVILNSSKDDEKNSNFLEAVEMLQNYIKDAMQKLEYSLDEATRFNYTKFFNLFN
jgi:hypothetical protein